MKEQHPSETVSTLEEHKGLQWNNLKAKHIFWLMSTIKIMMMLKARPEVYGIL